VLKDLLIAALPTAVNTNKTKKIPQARRLGGLGDYCIEVSQN